MLAEAKDTSELMVDVAYAALFFDDPDMADEVEQLESQISELVHQMRALCIIAVRNPREAEAMSAVLQVISAVESIGNDAVDIAKIVVAPPGHPPPAGARHVGGRGGVAPGGGGARIAFRQPAAVGLRAAGAHRHAGRSPSAAAGAGSSIPAATTS